MDVTADMREAAEEVMPGVVSIAAEPLTGGSSASVSRLDLAGKLHRRVVFRQHTDRASKGTRSTVAAKEFHLTSCLHASGFAVPRPLALHAAAFVDGPWLVTELVEGAAATHHADVGSVLEQMADFLARMHAVNTAEVDHVGLSVIENPQRELPKHLAADDTGLQIANVLDGGLHRQPNDSVVLHGDFWPGNVLFDHGRLAAVIDWEDAALGDPLVDLACARVELTCAYGPDSCDQFTQLYLAAADHRGGAPQLHDLALWDTYVSATALSAMHRWGLSPSKEAKQRAATQRFLDRAATALGSAW